MSNITERNILLRKQVELPVGLKLTTKEFSDEWIILHASKEQQFEKQIISCGWNLIKIADKLQHSGVGKSSQEATVNALRLTLLRVGEIFNAVEVEDIEMTQYPWFYLARVVINPCRVQHSASLPVPDHYEPIPIKARQRRLPVHANALYPHFGSAIPQLKQIILSSRTAQAGPQ